MSKYFLCDSPLVILPKPEPGSLAGEQKVSLKDFNLVPCGKCDHCRNKQAKEWTHRMILESRYYNGVSAFVTLTFNDKHLGDGNLDKEEIKLYLKRLRKRLKREIRYFIVGEYGPKNDRKHYHMILFNVDGTDVYNNVARMKAGMDPILDPNVDWTHVHQAWQGKGFTTIERPMGGAINYCAGYVQKIHKRESEILRLGKTPEFRMMSNGLGKRYVKQMATRIKQKKLKNPKLPMQYLEYPYKDKKSGKKKTVKRGFGRFLKQVLHSELGCINLLEIHNWLHKMEILYRYKYKGVLQMDQALLEETEMERNAKQQLYDQRILK